MIYPDSSFLVSFYSDETFSEDAVRFVTAARYPLIYTPFHRLETRNALRLRAFRKFLSAETLKETLRLIDLDLAEDILRHTPLDWNHALREAESVSQTHIQHVGARSADLLHVASALVLEAREFVTFDRRQAELGRRVGLKVKSWL